MNTKRYIHMIAHYNSISWCGHSIIKGMPCYYDRQKKVMLCEECGQAKRERELRQYHKQILERMRAY